MSPKAILTVGMIAFFAFTAINAKGGEKMKLFGEQEDMYGKFNDE